MSPGHYMYIETSAPRVPGNKAWLISQTFNPSTAPQCFTFWYHMYGSTIGMLQLGRMDAAAIEPCSGKTGINAQV
ncbi:hypothetical protein DPMN_011704 [Dreissena polymorpha]|uniref:MAM domain-containing protein n=1 Tax=Dreissena polymorpha TaxID=45954 RepID=A0A9D4S0J9_DREPO|nr:hypothetical protein DPMN_011704 [Dreissena polymorpha]